MWASPRAPPPPSARAMLGRETGGISRLRVRLLVIPSLLPRDPPPADVGAAETARPVDPPDGLVSAPLCLGHRLAARRHVEHAPAVCEQTRALAPRAGVKDLDTFD